jgi:hypothetical protein
VIVQNALPVDSGLPALTLAKKVVLELLGVLIEMALPLDVATCHW